MSEDLLIYGANGYTGQLVARLAVARGLRPVLAGRDATAVAALATELGLDHRAAGLDALPAILDGVRVVAHCAGPFSVTSAPMVAACLATGTHYLDITGETGVLEAVLARHDEAVAAGIVLLPGAGFDVVPTDCLAARLYAALPTATSLELAFVAGGGLSRGTATTAVAGMAEGGRVRRGGVLVASPPGSPRRRVPLPSGEREVAAIRWGDLVTAYRSTGIGDITTYTVLPGGRLAARVTGMMRWSPLRGLATRALRARPAGPSPSRRAATRSEVWGEVRDAAGASRSGTLVAPNPYDLTADSVLRAAALLVAGAAAPGAHTPSSAFGAGFAETLDSVTMTCDA